MPVYFYFAAAIEAVFAVPESESEEVKVALAH